MIEKTACNELAVYLTKSTNCTYRVRLENDAGNSFSKVKFFIGQTKFAAETGVVFSDFDTEEWLIKSIGNNIVLTGGRPRGTLYAVYHFLEDVIGVRWWTPWEESVPQFKSSLLPSIEMTGKPKFSHRIIHIGNRACDTLFFARNRVSSSSVDPFPSEYGYEDSWGHPHFVHTMEKYLAPETYFENHPEYFSLINGIRQPRTQPCLTNDDVYTIFETKLFSYIEQSRKEAGVKGLRPPKLFNISQNDRFMDCQCPACSAVVEREGSHAGLYLMFVNRLAEAVEERYPDVVLETLAYNQTQKVPKNVKPRGNVLVRLCPIRNDINHAYDHPNNKVLHKDLIEWGKIAPQLGIWDYTVWRGGRGTEPKDLWFWLFANYGGPVANYKFFGHNFRLYAENHVTAIFCENWYRQYCDLWELKTWVMAKLLENPYQDEKLLVETFVKGYYGQASEYMLAYLDLLEKSSAPFAIQMGSPAKYFTLDFVVKTQSIFDNAEKAAQGDNAVLDRVRFARLVLDRVALYRKRELYQERAMQSVKVPADFNIFLAGCFERSKATISRLAQVRGESDKNAEKLDRIEIERLTRAYETTLQPDLPEILKKYPLSCITEIDSQYWRFINPICITRDSKSALAWTVEINLEKIPTENRAQSFPVLAGDKFNMGIFNHILPEHVTASMATVSSELGYRVYSLARNWNPQTGDFCYLFNRAIQVNFQNVDNNSKDKYDVYFSMRADIDTSEKPKISTLFVDRFWFVKQ